MSSDFYGVSSQQINSTDLERQLEELSIVGYTTIDNLVSSDELAALRTKLESVYETQKAEVEPDFKLKDVQEENQVRAPLCYDEHFLEMARLDPVLDLVRGALGNYFVIQLQIGVINMPQTINRQSVWHRDLLYQDYVSSRPLSVSAMLCIDDFNEASGGTRIVPFSHRLDRMPSKEFIEKSAVTVNAKAGAVTVIDSMAIHMAGHNTSKEIRRGLNTIYGCGLFKQQISLPSQLEGKYSDDPDLRVLLGYDGEAVESVKAWRERRFNRSNSR